MNLIISPSNNEFSLIVKDIASDKSISHRSAIFSMLSNGKCVLDNFLMGEDTLNTVNILKQLGAIVEIKDAQITITPPQKLQEPKDVLDCGNSGTAIRLLCGFFASLEDKIFVLNGDESIRRRPMKRVIAPLNEFGANIIARENNSKAPIIIHGKKPYAFVFKMTISSAQVKSALILFALFAKDKCTIIEPEISRNHTEIMLKKMGAKVECEITNTSQIVHIYPISKKLNNFNIQIPSDPSSGFFFAVAVCLIKNSSITLDNILLNDTRIEAYKILQKMGADITITQTRNDFESVGNITIKHSSLNAVTVSKNIAWLIDEVPALAIAFCVAKGVSRVQNAKELRAKESDRIQSVVKNLNICGIKTQEFEDGFEVEGQDIQSLTQILQKDLVIDSCKDHRIAMSFSILGLLSKIQINDTNCILTSFPNFTSILQKIAKVEAI